MLDVFKFKNNDLIVKARKDFREQKKPRLYLWDLTDNKYISSLFKTELDGVFLFECNGKYYNIDLLTGIEERKKVFSPNNNREKGQNLSPDKGFQE